LFPSGEFLTEVGVPATTTGGGTEMKTCLKCKNLKEPVDFYKNRSRPDGLSEYCKNCYKQLDKKRREDPVYQEKYKEKNKLKARRQRARGNRRERDSKLHREWIARNKDKAKAIRDRYNSTAVGTVRNRLSVRLRQCIKTGKSKRLDCILGCTLVQLLQYLGPKPTDDAHIDHICPCAQAETPEELTKLFHYSNLRWLSARDNTSKQAKPTPEGMSLCLSLLGRPWKE
jgi:hypothetical protein